MLRLVCDATRLSYEGPPAPRNQSQPTSSERLHFQPDQNLEIAGVRGDHAALSSCRTPDLRPFHNSHIAAFGFFLLRGFIRACPGPSCSLWQMSHSVTKFVKAFDLLPPRESGSL